MPTASSAAASANAPGPHRGKPWKGDRKTGSLAFPQPGNDRRGTGVCRDQMKLRRTQVRLAELFIRAWVDDPFYWPDSSWKSTICSLPASSGIGVVVIVFMPVAWALIT